MSEQICIGIDIGVKDSWAVAVDDEGGIRQSTAGWLQYTSQTRVFHIEAMPYDHWDCVFVLEFPVFQGQRRVQKSTFKLVEAATQIRDTLGGGGGLYRGGNHKVYCPPANEIRRLMGWTPQCGKADRWVSWYLEDYYGGRTEMFVRRTKSSSHPQAGFLSNDHKRDACLAALWYLKASSDKLVKYKGATMMSDEYLEEFLWRAG